MSRQLGLRVVAEGIEHEEQLARLRGLECEFGQGDLFAKPLDVDQATELLKTGLAPQTQRSRSEDDSVRGEEPIPQLWNRGWAFMASHRVAVAVTALAVLLSAGMAATFSGIRPALVSSQVTEANAKQASVETVVAAPASFETTTQKAGNSAMLPSTPATPFPEGDQPSALSTAPAALTATTSVQVVHLHRLGNCRGRLDVTRDGVTFASEEGDGDEAFTLKYAEFLHALSDDTLTLKSAKKTYRFKAASSRGENPVQLREVADRIARSRH